MPVDAETYIRLHEEDYIFTPQFVPDSGTLTLVSATVTLYDSTGTVAGTPPVSAAAAVVTSGASSGPQAWYLLKPTTLALVVGWYTLDFLVVDSAGLKRAAVVLVEVRSDSDD